MSQSADGNAVLNALPSSFSTPELNVKCAEGEPHALVNQLVVKVDFVARELCAAALHYSLPVDLSFGLLAHTSQALPATKNAAFRTGLKGIVALVHGTSRADKEWPLAHWRELGQRLNAAGFGLALPHGSDAEESVCHAIAQDLKHAQVWPRLALDALTDNLANCVGAIGVDSGLSHVAVALDLLHVQIYNFDTARRTGPLDATLAGPPATLLPGLSGLHADVAARQRQCSVFAQPSPSVDAVWQAWLGLLPTALAP